MQHTPATPILATKLYPPPGRESLVHRRRLTALLDAGMTCPLTLISAPPGFGKTTLVSEWHATRHEQHDAPALAWLSLDVDDNDSARFFRYLIAALRTVQPSLGNAVVVMLESSPPPPAHTVMTLLINELDALATPLLLVLDDYHVIESSAIHDAVKMLIERPPKHLHVFITTRADPPFPFSRWRTRGVMVEVRQNDLRFTPAEITRLMQQSAIGFSPNDVTLLEARTEGWAAALQLAALATKGYRDAGSFVASFSGDHHYVMDYLTDEVLARQPAQVQDFLLATSVLERMCIELCTAVAGETLLAAGASPSLLEQLERANLFIIPLDDERRWYRYHHLFAEVLRGRLRRDNPQRVAQLHRSASAWYAANGLIDEAIHHAFAGKDFIIAADLIEGYAETLFIRGSTDLLRKLIAGLPEDVRNTRPRLLAYQAFFLALAQRFDEAEHALTVAEDTSHYRHAGGAALNTLRAEADVVRTLILLGRSQFHETIQVGQRALQYLPPAANRQRGTALQRMGTASSWLGDLPASIRYYRHALKLAEDVNNVPTVLRCRYNLAVLEFTPSQARLGCDRLRDVLAFAEAHNMGDTGNAGFVLQDLAEIEYELNNIDTALQLAQRAVHIARQDDAPNLEVLGHCTHAKCLSAHGRHTEALETAQHAFDLILRFNMVVRYTALAHACWLRACLHAGQIDAAAAWIDANPLQPEEFLTVRGVEFAARARVLRAQQRPAKALRLIAQVAEDARRKRMTRSRFAALPLQVVTQHEAGDTRAAHDALVEALEIGEPDRLLRAFLDEGEPMYQVIQQWRKTAGAVPQPAPLMAYTSALLAAFSAKAPPAALLRNNDFFSERELEVLRLISAGQSNQEIAGALFISVATVKKHLYNVYGKLGVKSRTQALARAREIGLL